jgi:hypothetical protein
MSEGDGFGHGQVTLSSTSVYHDDDDIDVDVTVQEGLLGSQILGGANPKRGRFKSCGICCEIKYVSSDHLHIR